MTTKIITNNIHTLGDYTGVTSGRMRETAPTANEPGVMTASSYGSGDRGHGLLKFTGLSNITGPVTCSGSTIQLKCNGVAGAAGDVSLYKLLVNNSTAQATWNERLTGTNWTSDGGYNATDISTTALATVNVSTSGTVYTWSGAGLDAALQDFINTPANHFGFLIARTGAPAGDSIAFDFLDIDVGFDDGPILTVVYTAGGGPTTIGASSQRFNSNRHTFGIRR